MCFSSTTIAKDLCTDAVKQFISRWAASILKEAEALIKAKALVPLTVEEQRALEMSGKLVVLPAKGVFTVKPPDQEMLTDDDGHPRSPGDPAFYTRELSGEAVD